MLDCRAIVPDAMRRLKIFGASAAVEAWTDVKIYHQSGYLQSKCEAPASGSAAGRVQIA
jgi:hypothetical protein